MSNISNQPKVPSISSLQYEKQAKDSSKNEIFNIVLNKIIQKIVYTNRHTDQTYIIFEIPQILIGYPQYDMKSCILFVMEKLSLNNYFIEFVNPFYLYIDWGSSPLNNVNKTFRKNNDHNISKYHKEKLRSKTKNILEKFPDADEIEFVYEDELTKKNIKKNIKKK